MKLFLTAGLLTVFSLAAACTESGASSGGGSGSRSGGGSGSSGGSAGGGSAGGSASGGGAAAALTVTSTSPLADATDVALNARVAATFSTAMDPASLTASSFSVQQADGGAVLGSLSTSGSTSTFTPAMNLAASSRYSATVSTLAKDTSGRALSAPRTWTFTTGTSTAAGPAPVGLGAAAGYAVLAKTAVSTVPASTVTGNVGLSPAAASYLTGFSLVADATNVFATSTQVVGKVYAATYATPTPANLTTAVGNMESAYTDAAGRPTPDFVELGSGNIGGRTLAPGLYTWTSTVTVPTDVTLAGGANDVWIFQTTGDLSVSAAKRVTLSGGALARNVFWQVAGTATLGAGAHLEGIILCKTAITLQTGASLNGRALAQTQVVLQQATLTAP